MLFRDRREAGKELSLRLGRHAGDATVVLALPRGGVPVGYEVAKTLGVPLEVFLVRKLGVPGREELAMGAIATGGVVVVNPEVTRALRIPGRVIEEVAAEEALELERCEHLYRQRRTRFDLGGKTVILVDDGLATGSTLRAAVAAVRKLKPKRVVVAVPVAGPDTCRALAAEADEMVCLQTPEPFAAVGAWYDDSTQTEDGQVREILARAAREREADLAVARIRGGDEVAIAAGGRGAMSARSGVMPEARTVRLAAGGVQVDGDLTVPPEAKGLVVFAHGSGSSRFSPRNQFVAGALNLAGLATLLVDLLTPEEEEADRRTRAIRFDIGRLAERLVDLGGATEKLDETRGLGLGFFGSSTGGGAALVAAAELKGRVGAVVSRGGRPDLAGEALGRVRCPTLLLVGGADEVVLELNRQALAAMAVKERRLVVVPGATHLFEEPGALEQVAGLARDWFVRWLGDAGATL